MAKKKELPETEIRPAHVWTCENCGKDNFEYTIVAEVSDEEREEMGDLYGEDMGIEWLTFPLYVKCKYCKSEYKSKDMHEDEFD